MKRLILLFFVTFLCLSSLCGCSQIEPPHKVKAVIVPHDVVALKLAEDVISSLVDSNPKTIVLVGPNHTAKGPKITSTHDGSKLSNLIGANDELIKNEHSIGNLMPLIERHLPNAKVVPVVFQKGASFAAAKKVMDVVFSEPDAIIIASIDFSHGLSAGDERVNRAKMEEYIKGFDSSSIMGLDETYLDAPVILATMMEVLKECRIDIIASTNATEVLGKEVPDATGYLTMVFYE